MLVMCFHDLSLVSAYNRMRFSTLTTYSLNTPRSRSISINAPKMVTVPPAPIPDSEEGMRVSTTFSSFFLGLRFLGFKYAIVLMFLGHYLVQKKSLIGQTFRALGFFTYAAIIILVDIFNSLKDSEASKSSGFNGIVNEFGEKWGEWEVAIIKLP